jgi:hypothetical protein
MSPDRRPIADTVAAMWARWIQEFAEEPANPPRGSTRALRECFYGGMLAAANMLAWDHPTDVALVRERYLKLGAELEAAIAADDHEIDLKDWKARTSEDFFEGLRKFLYDQAADPGIGMRIWNLMERCEDGTRQEPEHGFVPPLAICLGTLQAMVRDTFPREEDEQGYPKFPLATDLRILAELTLAIAGGGINGDQEQK